MADQPQAPLGAGKSSTTLGALRPVPPPPANVPTVPPPPQGLKVQSPNISNLTPSPGPRPSVPPPPAPPKPIAPPTIRTMSNDLASLQGMPPRPTPTIPPPPKPIPPPTPSAPKPMPIPPPPTPPRFSVPPPPKAQPISPSSVQIPPSGSSSKKWWIIGIVVLLAVAAGLWFLLFKPSEPEETPTPTPEPSETPLPTPEPAGFDVIFPLESVRLQYQTTTNASTALAKLNTSINQQNLAAGNLRSYQIIRGQEGASVMPDQMLADLGIPAPVALSAAFSPNTPVTFILFGKPDGTNGRGFAVKLQDAAAATSALTAWEPSMTSALKDLFKINPVRAASQGFLENIYQGMKVRYRNFGDAFSTIDYAVLTMPDGTPYLVFTNTRDHLFAIINALIGYVPGK